MKKKLFTLLLCAFAVVSANAYDVKNDTLFIYGSNDMGFGDNKPEGVFSTIKFVGDFTSGWSGNWLTDNGDADSKASVTSIDLSGANFGTGNAEAGTPKWGFSNFENVKVMKSENWPPAGNITVIPEMAFKHCGLDTLYVPGYIERIKANAVSEDDGARSLKSIIFEEYDPEGDGTSNVNMLIETQAFQQTKGLTDVYIDNTGTVSANNNAFPHWSTYGHADPNRELATLHFPTSVAEKYYNKNHVLTPDTAANNKKFQEWLVNHYSKAGQAANGFYEFVSNGTTDTEGAEWGDQFLRTYSHPTLDQIVPNGVKAYIVNALSYDNTNKTVTMKLKKVNVIPHGTGVILFGGTNSKDKNGKKILSMQVVKYEGEAFDRSSGDFKNYLTATANTEGKAISVEPYGKDQHGYIHRDFVFGKFSNTDSGKKYKKEHGNYGNGAGRASGDWYGFFRVKAGVMPNTMPGKAYLMLSETEYPYPDGGEIIIDVTDQTNSSNTAEYYRTEYVDQNLGSMSEELMKSKGYWWIDENTQILWQNNWGTRLLASGFTMAKYTGELEDEDWMISLGLSNVEVKENKGGDIYNLQGMKVAQPTKGIYIQNGKKYIVK